MNIIMMTNTYKPIMGGLEKSIESFSKEFRKRGHRVIIAAPEFENMVPEDDVIRLPAIQNISGTDFSLQLPIPGELAEKLGDMVPDIIHSHHPFLVGNTALRMAYKFNKPLIFTHHTLYEQNTHFFPGDSEAMKRFVIELATGYANLADRVFAPSESVMELIKERGVETPIEVVPTGSYTERYAKGDGGKMRKRADIPKEAYVVGHLGRLSPEKNLEFLAKSIIYFLSQEKKAHFLLVGKGPSEETLPALFQEAGVADRLHMTGPLSGQDLVDSYHAMDVFAFASQSETQGLVLVEAMASGLPVVALDAPGAREVVKDEVNGRLLMSERAEDFVAALQWVMRQSPESLAKIKVSGLEMADDFSMGRCVSRALEIYTPLAADKQYKRKQSDESGWAKAVRLIQAQWDITKNITKATKEAALPDPDKQDKPAKDSVEGEQFSAPRA